MRDDRGWLHTVMALLFGCLTAACSSNEGTDEGTGGSAGTGGGTNVGVCGDDGDCPAGQVCSAGACAEPCSDSCADGSTCCAGGYCADTAFDPKHCGGCGVACGDSQFCGTSGCVEATFANLCAAANAVVLLDAIEPDELASAIMAEGLMTACPTPPAIRTASQDSSGVIDAMSGQPTSVEALLVVMGGAAVQRHAYYAEQVSQAAPVYSAFVDMQYQLVERATGRVIMSASPGTVSATHDYLLIEVVRDPTLGVASLIAFGFGGDGTQAAARYLSEQVLPSAAMHPKSWYAYEWTKTGDEETFEELASAP